MSSTFGARLAALSGPQRLCVGIDPHPSTLDSWGLPDNAEGTGEFARAVVDAAIAGGIRLIKPQVALFERQGVSGMSVLSNLMSSARDKGLLVIADVKRGDIGTSLAGYAQAWLESGSDFEADAMTAVAYQGVGSLEPAFSLAAERGKGVFVLAATSNSEGWAIQSATTNEGDSVAQRVVSDVAHRSIRAPHSDSEWLGVVIGATTDRTQFGLDDSVFSGVPILAPGFGAQGISLTDLTERFGSLSPSVIPTVSRSVAGDSREGIDQRVSAHVGEVQALW